MYRGAEEAMVVTYSNDEHYHGVDGFNDVTFDTCPDTSRLGTGKIQRKYQTHFSRIHQERAWR